MKPEVYALGCALLALNDLYPLPVRVAWLSFLRRSEPDALDVQKAALNLHERGLMHAGQLTPQGVPVARKALTEALEPPPLYRTPHGGAGGEA